MDHFRILQCSGFAPEFDKESGIVHAKVWISDKNDVYIGSTNYDWKSLTPGIPDKEISITFFTLSLVWKNKAVSLLVLLELGLYFADCPQVGKIKL
jgi:phospholipase D3/4